MHENRPDFLSSPATIIAIGVSLFIGNDGDSINLSIKIIKAKKNIKASYSHAIPEGCITDEFVIVIVQL